MPIRKTLHLHHGTDPYKKVHHCDPCRPCTCCKGGNSWSERRSRGKSGKYPPAPLSDSPSSQDRATFLVMKEKNERKKQEQEYLNKASAHHTISYLSRHTHFDTEQIRALIEIYKKIKGNHTMNRLRFRETFYNMFGLTSDLMLDRIFACFDVDGQGSVSEAEWVMGLSVMLYGTLEEQIAYCYEVYDINSDGAVGREEVSQLLKGSLHPHYLGDEVDVESGTHELVELAMRQLDFDRDTLIKIKDFRHAAHMDPLLLQALGETLPSDKCLMTFISLIDHRPRRYAQYLSHPGDPGWNHERLKYQKGAEVKEAKAHIANTRASHKVVRLQGGGSTDSNVSSVPEVEPQSWKNRDQVRGMSFLKK